MFLLRASALSASVGKVWNWAQVRTMLVVDYFTDISVFLAHPLSCAWGVYGLQSYESESFGF